MSRRFYSALRSASLPDDVLERAKVGDRHAVGLVVASAMAPLRRWASRRLPRWARDLADTSDLVQETLLRTLKHVDRLEVQRTGGVEPYLRRALMNLVRDELRRAARRPAAEPVDPSLPSPGPTIVDAAIARQTVDRYERALATLSNEERRLVESSVELGLSYPEIARLTGRPSANAARMAVSRALVKLARRMQDVD
jgi:RNA polymerase sigma-70 factor (ECF subfamily)